MAKVKKEPLKERDPYRYYRNVHYALYSVEWVSIFTPLAILFGIKWNDYFNFVEETEGSVKLTIGCILAIVLAIVFAVKKARVEEKSKKTYSMLHYVGFVAVFWAFAFLFKVIIDDLFLITSVELAGAVTAYGVSIADNNAKEKARLFKEQKIKQDGVKAYGGNAVE